LGQLKPEFWKNRIGLSRLNVEKGKKKGQVRGVNPIAGTNLRELPFGGGGVAHRELNPHHQHLGEKSEIAHRYFIILKKIHHPPSLISAFATK